ncbi:hypothetical protein ACFX15_032108 [Malus domestica]
MGLKSLSPNQKPAAFWPDVPRVPSPLDYAMSPRPASSSPICYVKLDLNRTQPLLGFPREPKASIPLGLTRAPNSPKRQQLLLLGSRVSARGL